MPTNTNVRNSFDMCSRPVASSAASRPMIAEPATFTAPVAYGTARSSTCANTRLTAWRAIEPSAPPPATAIQIIVVSRVRRLDGCGIERAATYGVPVGVIGRPADGGGSGGLHHRRD